MMNKNYSPFWYPAYLKIAGKKLWFGTKKGLYSYNREDNKLNFIDLQTHPQFSKVSSIIEDDNGFLWLGIEGSGLVRYNPVSNYRKRYDLKALFPNQRTANKIRVLCRLSSGQIAVGTFGGGLWFYNPKTDEFKLYRNNPRINSSINDDHIFSLMEDRSQILWVGTFQGVNKCDLKEHKFQHFRSQFDENISRNWEDEKRNNFILSILKDENNRIWCATLGAGLIRLDEKTGNTTNFRQIPGKKWSLNDNYIWSLYRDKSSNIWIGTGLGLQRFNKRENQFETFDINEKWAGADNVLRAMLEDNDGKLWLGFYGAGLHRFDPKKNIFSSYRHIHLKPGSNQPYMILSLFQDKAGIIWIGTDGGGLIRFDPKTISEKSIYENIFFEGIKSPRVNSINEDKNGYLWVGTSNGLVMIDPERDKIIYYDESNGLSNSFIYAIEIDWRNNIWVSTNRGLTRIRKIRRRSVLI